MGHIRSIIPPEKAEREVTFSEPVRVGEIINQMGLGGYYTGIIVNGKRSDENCMLDEDSELFLISPASGG